MIGSNQGGNLNILVFEVGIVTTDPTTGAEKVSTVSVHPLVVAPRSIRYQDGTRTPVMETTGGSIVTRAGRALRTVALEGMFGVENRGLALYLGTGEVRFQRFYKEVVRLSDALSADDVAACVDQLNGTPFISLLVKPFIEGQSTCFINFYDFWNGISFQALLTSFNWGREFKNGGASGNISYQMQVREVGPVKSGGLGNSILSTLLDVLGTWDDLNQVLTSYTATNVVDSLAGVAAIAVSEISDTLEAVTAQLASVQSLMGGNVASSLSTNAGNEGIASFFSACARLMSQCDTAGLGLTQMMGARELDADHGAIKFDQVEAEGRNRLLFLYETLADLENLADSARFNLSAGKFYGMGRASYQTYILGGGVQGLTAPELSGSVSYRVSISDTPESIAARFGVAWATILDANNLTPDEALFPGTEIRIPTTRPRGTAGIDGLPTFGSHLGEDAWGVDLPLELEVADGTLATVSGTELLEQGVQFLVEQETDALLQASQAVPEPARADYLSQRILAVLLLDGRFSSTSAVEVTLDESTGAFDVQANLYAINGGKITTGGSP